MFIIGDMCGTPECAENSTAGAPVIENLTLRGGKFDDAFITYNTDATTISADWDFDTAFHASFNGNLSAGNTEFAVENTSSIRIKRRKVGELNWLTLFEIPITTANDFSFSLFDRYARHGQRYEYAVIPVTVNVLGELTEAGGVTADVLSEFDGIFLSDKDRTFYTIADMTAERTSNRPVTIITTLGRQFPIAVSVGEARYYSGNVTGLFVERVGCALDFKNGWAYRDSFNKWLQNGRPKILKDHYGNIWIIAPVGEVSETENGHWQRISSSFAWTQIGDAEKQIDLYNNGFVDTYDGQ